MGRQQVRDRGGKRTEHRCLLSANIAAISRITISARKKEGIKCNRKIRNHLVETKGKRSPAPL